MILGLDSAQTITGWALVQRNGTKEELVATGKLHDLTARVVSDFASRVVSKPGLVDLVVIEDAFLGKSVSVTKTLSQLVGRWRQEFERMEIPTRMVMATVWQKGLLEGLIHSRTTSDARKAAAINWVRGVYGVDLGPDEADAACMATWVSRDRAMRRLVRDAIHLR